MKNKYLFFAVCLLLGLGELIGCGGGTTNDSPPNATTPSSGSGSTPSTSPEDNTNNQPEENTNNQAPIITSLPPIRTINEGEEFSYELIGNDSDGDVLIYRASNIPENASFDSNTNTFSWTPQNGQAGSYSVNFTVSDGNLSATQTVTLLVIHVNHAPTITLIGNQTINEGQLLEFSIDAQDVDNDSLTFSVDSLPSGASFNSNSHVFSWTPNLTQSGSYPVTFRVSDGNETVSETITISVGNVNLPPTITPIGNRTINENQLLSFTTQATDPENNPLTYGALNLPTGSSFNSGSHTFLWTPGYNQSGSYSVTFTVNDGFSTTTQIIIITVNNVNRAPTISATPPVSIGEGELISVNLVASDPDNTPLTFNSNNLPSGSSLNSSTGLFQWYPDLNQNGIYDVTLNVTDGSLSATTSLHIVVNDTWDRIVVVPSLGLYDPAIDELGNLAYWWDGGMYLRSGTTTTLISQDSHCGYTCNVGFSLGGTPSISNGKVVWVSSENYASNFSKIKYYDGISTRNLTRAGLFAQNILPHVFDIDFNAMPIISNDDVLWLCGPSLTSHQVCLYDGASTQIISTPGDPVHNYPPYLSEGKAIWIYGTPELPTSRLGYYNGGSITPLSSGQVCDPLTIVGMYSNYILGNNFIPWIIRDTPSGPCGIYTYDIPTHPSSTFGTVSQDIQPHSDSHNLVWRRPHVGIGPGTWDVMFYDGIKPYRVYRTGFAGAPKTGAGKIAWRDQETGTLYLAYKR